MHTLNNKNRIDESTGIVENILGMKAKKTPWHLRFAPGVLNMKGIAATTGIASFFGLLFAGLQLCRFNCIEQLPPTRPQKKPSKRKQSH